MTYVEQLKTELTIIERRLQEINSGVRRYAEMHPDEGVMHDNTDFIKKREESWAQILRERIAKLEEAS
jgi:hypothetical protein